MIRLLSLLIIAGAVFFVMQSEPTPDKRILFIGNSFTFGGDVPVQVQNIAATANPATRYFVQSHVRGGTSLEQHLSETAPLATIASDAWDVVVLQDASMMPFEPHYVASMDRATTILAQAAEDQGAQVLYFAHWSPSTYIDTRAQAVGIIEDTYRRVAQTTGGDIAPVGRLFQMAEDAGVGPLYGADEHHSSIKGAYAAALMIAATLGDVDVSSTSWAPRGVSEAEQMQLRTLAATLASTSP